MQEQDYQKASIILKQIVLICLENHQNKEYQSELTGPQSTFQKTCQNVLKF